MGCGTGHGLPTGPAVRFPRPRLLGLPLAALLLWLPAPAASGEDAVAVVNGVSIGREAFDREWPAFLRKSGIPPGGPEEEAAAGRLRRELVERLVREELLFQDAVKKGYLAGEAAVDREIDRVCRPMGGLGAVDEILNRSGFSLAQFREHLRRRLTVGEYVKREVAPGVTVAPAEVESLLRSQRKVADAPEEVRVRHIMARVPVGAAEEAREAARRKMKEVAAALSEGGDFAALARKHSECDSAPRGGDLGFFSRGRMSQAFEEAAFALEPGEVSGIFETPYGFHLIRLEERRRRPEPSREELAAELADRLRQEKVEEALASRAARLRELATVVVPPGF